VRSTQSLVHIIASCWSRPGLLARELAWRWLFGIPALLLILFASRRLPWFGVELVPLDPANAARGLVALVTDIWPALLRIVLWLVPLLGVGWAAASGLGRASLLRGLAPPAAFRPVPLILLQLLRFVALLASGLLWALLVRWAATGTVAGLPPGAEPRTVSFAAWLICLSLGSFSLWAVWSWVLSLASVLCVVEERSAPASLHAAVRAGALIPRLIEVNLVLGIVKLALIVLAMVFASIPLPFEAVMSGVALYIWWVLVGLGYLAASDFFQIVRLAAFLELRQRAAGEQQIH
jgi:hypothetical protein